MKTFLLAAALAATALVPVAAQAAGESPWQIRARAIGVIPDEGATVTPLGGSVDIDTSWMPEVDVTYFITDNIALELIAATMEHSVKHTPTSTNLGSVWLLPPTLTLQYHFQPKERFRPYVGAGVNYTIFYNEKAGALTSVSYDNAFGFALQAGADFAVGDSGYFLNIDVKKVFLETDVSFNGGAIRAKVDIDPWIVGVGFGYRF